MLTAVVDLPTPPLPEPTAMTWRTPATGVRGAGPGRPCAAAWPVAGALSEVSDTMTLRPPATAAAAACAASRTGPKAASMPGRTAMAKATALVVTMISERP